jgi:hypothetical protein
MSLVRVASMAAALVASAGLVCLGQNRQAPQFRRTPDFAGAAIPDPPEQGRPWTPPAMKLPRFLARATSLLFEQQVADPRGCEYREVDLGDATLLTTHAFVLPARPGDAGRFAVGWDGVVYPAFRVGDAADLDADIRALADAMKDRRAKAAKDGGPRAGAWRTDGFTGLSTPLFRPMGEKPTGPASVETASALKVCLLLRLGRADLAEALFATGTTWTPDVPPPDLTDYHLSYLTLAQEWADRVYNRAVDAHGRGDDAVALDVVRRVSAFVARAGPALEAMGFPPPANAIRPGDAPRYFSKLGQLRELLADQERRHKEPPRGPIPGPEAPAAERVAALMLDLDQVAGGTGIVMNGMTSPSGSDTEKALVLEGNAAVEPLLAALESDDRLTRTISHPGSRHGQDDRLIHHVVQVEQSALIAIMKTRAIPGVTNLGWDNDRASRRASAAAIRAYWEKNRGVPELERYYRTLADDRATMAQWLDAAEALAQPSDVRGRGGSYTTPYRVGGKVPPHRGESLRGRTDPGVTALIAKRVESIDPSASRVVPHQGSGEIFEVSNANRMATLLAGWDPKGAVPTLKVRVARSASILRAAKARDVHEGGLATDIARMTTLRLKADDPSALDDYAAWARTVAPPDYGFFAAEMFEPMWRHPDHPAIASAVRSLFDDPASPWVPLFRPGDRGWQEGGFKAGVITSPLLGLEPFRKLVLAGLADLRENGSVDVDASGKVTVRVGKEMTEFPIVRGGDPLRPPPSSSTPLRLADLYASTFATIAGFPPCERYWPISRRDEAIAACAATLRQYGPRLRYSETTRTLYEAAPFYPQHQRAILAFDPLDRPATADDVREGRAIFHIEGGEVRRWPMPALPMPARWTTLEIPDHDPGLRGFDLSKERPRAQVEMLQSGNVWQAEEVRDGDRWRRSYGLVWRHGLARVPAEAIEFPPPWNTGWYRISPALDGRLVAPGGVDDGTRMVKTPVKHGAPLMAEVWLRNHRGVDAEAPGPWSRDEGGMSLREGVAIRLYRRPGPPPRSRGQLPDPPPSDVEIPPRAARRHRDGAPSLTLASTATARVLRLDLRDLFAVEVPGQYRLEVMADDLKLDDGSRGVLSANFTLAEAP